MPSGKYNVFGALIRCQAGTLHYTFIIRFGLAMLLTLWWPLSYQLLRIKLTPNAPLHGQVPFTHLLHRLIA